MGIRIATGRFLHGNYDPGMAGERRRRGSRAPSDEQARLHLPRRRRRRQDHHLGRARARARRARAEGGRDHDRPGPAPGGGAGPGRALRARRRRWASIGSTRRCSPRRASTMKGELWAMMLDPKRTFDEIVTRARARRARARGDPRQPDLPRALHGGRRLAGAERDRKAVRAPPRARLRRDRARHAAVAQRAGLPRRAHPAAGLPGRARAEGVPRSRRPHRAPVRPLHRARVLDLRARHRRGHAERSVAVLPLGVGRDRRLRRAHPRRRLAAARAPTRPS